MEQIYSTVNKTTTTSTVEVQRPTDNASPAAFPTIKNSPSPRFLSDEIYMPAHSNSPSMIDIRKQHTIEIYDQQQPSEMASENYTVRLQPSSTEANSSSNNKTKLFSSINWSDTDTYIHIFLTFFFGHFASMLFFDGILRNIESLIIFNRTFFYVLYIIFSIVFLAFTVWMLTILWRWWRNVSLLPNDASNYVPNVPKSKRQQKLIAQNYVFLAAILLAVGLLIYLAIGIIDNRIKYYHYDTFYYGDTIVFVLRLILWFVAIIALLALNRDYFVEMFFPNRFKKHKNKNEPQTIVYEVRQN